MNQRVRWETDEATGADNKLTGKRRGGEARKKNLSKRTSELLVPAEKRPCRRLCKCPSHSLSRNPNSAWARVCARPLWSPYTLYYSFPDIICGFWPYFQRAEREKHPWEASGSETGSSVSTSAYSKRRCRSLRKSRAPRRKGMECKIAYGYALSF